MNKGIIDVHHHIIPDVYKSALVKNGVDKAGGMPLKDWTPEAPALSTPFFTNADL